MVDTKKFERCAYLKKAIVAKVPIYSTDLVAVIFVYESIRNHSILILSISQQQLQLFIKYCKFFRRAIVNICTCKGDFGNSCFLQRAAHSRYLEPEFSIGVLQFLGTATVKRT